MRGAKEEVKMVASLVEEMANSMAEQRRMEVEMLLPQGKLQGERFTN